MCLFAIRKKKVSDRLRKEMEQKEWHSFCILVNLLRLNNNATEKHWPYRKKNTSILLKYLYVVYVCVWGNPMGLKRIIFYLIFVHKRATDWTECGCVGTNIKLIRILKMQNCKSWIRSLPMWIPYNHYIVIFVKPTDVSLDEIYKELILQ